MPLLYDVSTRRFSGVTPCGGVEPSPDPEAALCDHVWGHQLECVKCRTPRPPEPEAAPADYTVFVDSPERKPLTSDEMWGEPEAPTVFDGGCLQHKDSPCDCREILDRMPDFLNDSGEPTSDSQAPAVPGEVKSATDPKVIAEIELIRGWFEGHPDSAIIDELAARSVKFQTELAQLRACVSILDAQKVELPEKESPTDEDCAKIRRWTDAYPNESSSFWAAQLVLLCRERQLRDVLRAVQAKDNLLRDLRNSLVAARDFIDSGDSGWFPQQWRDAIAAYEALAGKGGK